MKNIDKIRAMSTEKLAEWLDECGAEPLDFCETCNRDIECEDCPDEDWKQMWMEWLEREIGEKREDAAVAAGDTIRRQAAIMDAESWVAVDEYEKHLQKNVVEWLKEFPPAEPEIIECDPVKACNEATMNKVFSAYRYLSMLEDLKVYGYVLAKRRTK